MATVNPMQQGAIQNLQMPTSNQKVVSGLTAANTLGLQSLGQGITKGLTSGVGYDKIPNVTTAAAQQSVISGQKAVAKADSDINTQGRVGGAALTQMADEAKNQLGLKKLSLDNQLSKNEARLAQLNANVKTKLVDEQLAFRRDQMGRVQFSEHQLMDWAVLKAQSGEEFKNYAQTASQTYDRYSQLLAASSKRIQFEIDSYAKKTMSEADQKTKVVLAKAKALADEKAAAAAKHRLISMAQWQAGGTIVGGIVGGVAGAFGSETGVINPYTGAMAGMAVGGATGTYVGSRANI